MNTTAAFAGSVTLCFTYDPAKYIDPDSLRLLHFENSAWVDVTTTNNTSTNTLCGQVNSFSIFAAGEPSLSPSRVWIGLKNSDDVGIKFDLLAELYKDASLVGSGQVNSVPGGSSGFNNAKLHTISFSPSTPNEFPAGTILSINYTCVMRVPGVARTPVLRGCGITTRRPTVDSRQQLVVQSEITIF